MKIRGNSPRSNTHVTIRVAGKLFRGHLTYLDQLVRSAAERRLWPVLNLAHLEEADRAAILYLTDGENRDFEIACSPRFVRDWIELEGNRAAA